MMHPCGRFLRRGRRKVSLPCPGSTLTPSKARADLGGGWNVANSFPLPCKRVGEQELWKVPGRRTKRLCRLSGRNSSVSSRAR